MSQPRTEDLAAEGQPAAPSRDPLIVKVLPVMSRISKRAPTPRPRRPFPLDLAAPMRSLRDAAGLTQVQMAAKRGITQPGVADSEKIGDAVSVATLRKAAEAAGLTLEIRVRGT